MILIDTDICIEILRGNQKIIDKRKVCNDNIAISFMTVAELYYGVEKSKNRLKNSGLVNEFILTVDIFHTDIDILKKFGELKAQLSFNKSILPDADILIASTALLKCDKLITGNLKHFKRFEELTIENWLR